MRDIYASGLIMWIMDAPSHLHHILLTDYSWVFFNKVSRFSSQIKKFIALTKTIYIYTLTIYIYKHTLLVRASILPLQKIMTRLFSSNKIYNLDNAICHLWGFSFTSQKHAVSVLIKVSTRSHFFSEFKQIK